MQRSIFNLRVIFAFLLILAFGYGIYGSFSHVYLARIFPLYISIFMFVLALMNFSLEFQRNRRKLQESKEGLVELEVDWGEIPVSEVKRRLCFSLGIITLLYGSIWMLGFTLSVTLYVILSYRFISRTNLWWAMVAGLATLGFISLTSKLIVIDLPGGIIQKWINLPWPFG